MTMSADEMFLTYQDYLERKWGNPIRGPTNSTTLWRTSNQSPLRLRRRIRVVHHPLKVDLLVAIWTRLLLSHDAPAADAKLMKSDRGRGVKAQTLNHLPSLLVNDRPPLRIHVTTGQTVGVLDEPLLLHIHQDPLTAHSTDIVREAPAGHAPPAIVLSK